MAYTARTTVSTPDELQDVLEPFNGGTYEARKHMTPFPQLHPPEYTESELLAELDTDPATHYTVAVTYSDDPEIRITGKYLLWTLFSCRSDLDIRNGEDFKHLLEDDNWQ